MLSHLRRGLQPDFDGNTMPTRTLNNQKGHWKSSDQVSSLPLANNLLPEPYSSRSHSNAYPPDLSRALRVDASLLAIVRIDDRRNTFYSAEVASKLRQKEQTQSFINKPCSLYVTDRSLVIFDRATQIIAETIPLENVDPTCVHADVPDTLNDIFMYRLVDRQLVSTTSQTSSTTSSDTSPVVVFKCSNNEARVLVDSIRTATGKPLKHSKSATLDTRVVLDHRVTDPYYSSNSGPGLMQHMITESTHMNNPAYIHGSQQTRTITQQTTLAATDYYKHLTEELNKCFDDIELFVRYLEAVMEYTKELERDYRRKEKKSTTGLKQMVEKLPDDRYFIDILQKFKHSFNLLGELKQIIHNPNAPELVHYLLSPLQFILYTLRSKHANHSQITQEIWIPALTKEAKELLLNCLTSKEHEILRNLGPAWVRTADESTLKFSDYRPVFYDGRAIWIQDGSIGQSQPAPISSTRVIERTTTNTHPFTQFDEKQQQAAWTTTTTTTARQAVNNNGLTTNYNTVVRQPSPIHFESSTLNRSPKKGVLEDYNNNMQNEHAWAIDRKRAGAKVCAVKIDRKGHNAKELTVRRGELIEIEDSSKKWWRARNFLGEVGHVPNNIVEEIEIEQRPMKVATVIPPVINSYHPLPNSNSRTRYN